MHICNVVSRMGSWNRKGQEGELRESKAQTLVSSCLNTGHKPGQAPLTNVRCL
jgi:hypothetical protein